MSEIKALRESTGLTQRAFAELLGIPKRSIENWESEVSKPPEYQFTEHLPTIWRKFLIRLYTGFPCLCKRNLLHCNECIG